MEHFKLSSTLLPFAELVWRYAPPSVGALRLLCARELKWSHRATRTALGQLCRLGLLGLRGGTVSVLISQEEYHRAESQHLVEKTLHGTLLPTATMEIQERGYGRYAALMCGVAAVFVLLAVFFLTDWGKPHTDPTGETTTARGSPTTVLLNPNASFSVTDNLSPGGYFDATIEEIQPKRILVTPGKTSSPPVEADRFWVSLDVPYDHPIPAMVIGDSVRVVYYGTVTNTHPVQLNHVLDIYPIGEDGEVLGGSDWGIFSFYTDVSATGIELFMNCLQKDGDDELVTDETYWLETQVDGLWSAVPKLPKVKDTASTALYPLDRGSITLTLDWKDVYGKLPPGIYRVVKPVEKRKSDGNVLTQYHYLEFQLSEDGTYPLYHIYYDLSRFYLGETPETAVDSLPTLTMTTDKHIHTIAGHTYIEPVLSGGWRINLGLLQSVGKLADGTIAYGMEGFPAFLLLTDPEAAGSYRPLVSTDSSLLDILDCSLSDFYLYQDGKMTDETEEIQKIWAEHTGPDNSSFGLLYDGHMEYHLLTLISKECPAVFYHLSYSYGEGQERLFVTNIAITGNRESSRRHRDMLSGAVPEYNDREQPEIFIHEENGTYVLDGQSYVEVSHEAYTADTYGWYLDLGDMRPIGWCSIGYPTNQKFTVFTVDDNREVLLLKGRTGATLTNTKLLVRTDMGLPDISQYALSDFDLYLDGEPWEDALAAEAVWYYHTGKAESPALYLSSSLYPEHEMKLVLKDAPWWFYTVEFRYVPGYEAPAVENHALRSQQNP